MYTVKEIFFSIQGEGACSGKPAVFCRFSGCNLWNGQEKDRASSLCDFCDTDFVGINSDGGKFNTAGELASAIDSRWPSEQPHKHVICTGGEPLLQLDQPLVDELKRIGFEVAVETNGTLLPPANIDWICVSPKIGAPLKLRSGNELKLVYPQPGGDPARFLELDFQRFFLQPMDGPEQEKNIASAFEYCQLHPTWELSIQKQKLVGIR